MGCECYQIGGPFISEDPNCPLHGDGNAEDQINALRGEVHALTEKLCLLEAALRKRMDELEFAHKTLAARSKRRA